MNFREEIAQIFKMISINALSFLFTKGNYFSLCDIAFFANNLEIFEYINFGIPKSTSSIFNRDPLKLSRNYLSNLLVNCEFYIDPSTQCKSILHCLDMSSFAAPTSFASCEQFSFIGFIGGLIKVIPIYSTTNMGSIHIKELGIEPFSLVFKIKDFGEIMNHQ